MSTGHDAQILKYKLSVAGLRQIDEPLRLAHQVRHLGDAYRRAGEYSLAEPCYVEALSIYHSHEDRNPLDLANAIRGFAKLKQHAGALAAAEALWLEAHHLYLATNVLSGVAGSASYLAILAKERNDLTRSREWIETAVAAADKADDEEILQHVREVKAQLEQPQNNSAAADQPTSN